MDVLKLTISVLVVACTLLSCSLQKTTVYKPYKDVYVLDTVCVCDSGNPDLTACKFKSLRFDTCVVICNPVVAEYGGVYFLFSEKNSPQDFEDVGFYFGSNSNIYCSDEGFNLNRNNLHLYKRVSGNVSLYKFNEMPKCLLMLLVNMDMFEKLQMERIKSPKIKGKLHEIRECYFRVACPVYDSKRTSM